MKYGNLVVEKKELNILKQIISRVPQRIDTAYRTSLTTLVEELKSAIIVQDSEMPADVVRFNSVVTILDPQHKLRTYQIVTPEKGNIAENKLSIVAPMGLALFGYSQEDAVKWHFPVGLQTIRIVKVEQAESVNAVSHE